MKLASFDLFDTTLLRACGSEDNLFMALAYEILGDNADEAEVCEFVKIRKNAGLACRAQCKREAGTSEIYGMSDFSSLTSIPNERILSEELHLQEEMLYPNREIADNIDTLRQRGYSICFISDMHLSKEVLRKALLRNGILHPEDRLFVSSGYGKTKHEGSLFDYVRTQYVNLKEWRHYGDDSHSDYKVPLQKGIRAVRTNVTELPYYTKKTRNQESGHPIAWRDVHSSMVRTLAANDRDTYANLISEIIAPLYCSSVFSMLSDARRRHIKRLYFFSRDGFVFYKISKEFSPLFPEIKTYYLHVSRRTLYLPSVEEISLEAFIKLKPIKGLSIAEYLDQFHIDINLLEYEMGRNTEETLKNIFRRPSNIAAIKEEQSSLKQKLLCYFRQEGFLAEKTAMVDMTGSRSSQEALNRLFKSQGLNDLFAYYFFVADDRKSIESAGKFRAYIYADQLKGSPYKCLGDLCLLFEDVFSMTNQNRVIDYKVENNRIIPITDKTDMSRKKNTADKNLKVYVRYAHMFLITKLYIHYEEVLQNSLYIASLFAENPLYKYVKTLSRLQLSENSSHNHSIIARPWNHYFKESWYRGSLINLHPFMNTLFHWMIKYKNKKKE